jgi:hypothetical protein
VNLSSADSLNKNCKWLFDEMPFRRCSLLYYEKQFSRVKLNDWYDAVVFLRNTEHSESSNIGKKWMVQYKK